MDRKRKRKGGERANQEKTLDYFSFLAFASIYHLHHASAHARLRGPQGFHKIHFIQDALERLHLDQVPPLRAPFPTEGQRLSGVQVPGVHNVRTVSLYVVVEEDVVDGRCGVDDQHLAAVVAVWMGG